MARKNRAQECSYPSPQAGTGSVAHGCLVPALTVPVFALERVNLEKGDRQMLPPSSLEWK